MKGFNIGSQNASVIINKSNDELFSNDNIINTEFLLNFGFIKDEQGYNQYLLKIGATELTCRENSNRFYFEFPGLYIGEISKQDQLRALYYGLTNRISPPKATLD